MGVLDLLKDDATDTRVDKNLLSRIDRGRERVEQIAAHNDEAWEFYRGNHYAYVDEGGKLQFLQTGTGVRLTGKPPHRARQKRNLVFDVVLRHASAATQRVPSYQVIPSAPGPEQWSAASLAQKIALYGYTRWNLRRAAVDAITHALVAGEAFAWPYFDTNVGPFIDDGEGRLVGQGEICVRIFGANECFWEPGVNFEDSPWHVIEQARPVEQVMQMPDYLGGSLTPDADTRQLSHRGKSQGQKRLVLVTEYLERPSPKNPEGSWVVMANRRRVVPDRPYPTDGESPVLRKLAYAPDPDSDRDLGLVPQLLDAQRTHNDANNKAIEWKNHALMPRIFVTPGLMKKQRFTDEPGKVYEIPQPDANIKFMEVPAVPSELFEMADRAQRDMGRIAANNDIPSGMTAGSAVANLLDSDASRGALFTSALAEWHSQVMHDCLCLVQEYYSEQRTIQFRGDFGWETVSDFLGAQLRDEVDVRVLPDSITPQTKDDRNQRIMTYVQLGALSPEQGMTAIEAGTDEAILRSVAFDEARAGRIIQRIKAGEDLFNSPEIPTGRDIPATDEMGQPIIGPDGQPQTTQEMAPVWMPRFSDNLPIMRTNFEDWMKTEEFERLDPPMQEATALIYAGILQLEAEKAQQQQMAMAAQAEDLGMQNASAPQGDKPMPSLPKIGANGTDPNQNTP